MQKVVMSNGWRRKVVCYAISYRKTRSKSSAYGNGKGKKMVGSGGKMEVSVGVGVSEGSRVLVGVGVSVGVGRGRIGGRGGWGRRGGGHLQENADLALGKGAFRPLHIQAQRDQRGGEAGQVPGMSHRRLVEAVLTTRQRLPFDRVFSQRVIQLPVIEARHWHPRRYRYPAGCR